MGQPRQGTSQPNPLNDAELQAYKNANDLEWGVWIADPAGPGIYHEGALAYQPGAAVPVSNVARYAYDKQGLVVKRVPDKEVLPDPETPAPAKPKK